MIVDMSDPQTSRKSPDGGSPDKNWERKKSTRNIFLRSRQLLDRNHGAIRPEACKDGAPSATAALGTFGFMSWICPHQAAEALRSYAVRIQRLWHYPVHTCYPLIADARHPRLQNIVVALHEALEADCGGLPYSLFLDVKTREIRKSSVFPRPAAPPDAPYTIFASPADVSARHTQCWLAPGARILRLLPFPGSVPASGFSTSRIPRPQGGRLVRPASRRRHHKYETWWRGTTENVFR